MWYNFLTQIFIFLSPLILKRMRILVLNTDIPRLWLKGQFTKFTKKRFLTFAGYVYLSSTFILKMAAFLGGFRNDFRGGATYTSTIRPLGS